MKKFGILACLIFAIPNIVPVQASALDPLDVAATFERLTAGTALANPSVVVMDPQTGSVVYEKSGYSARKPASVLKIYSATAALTYLDPTERFTTSAWVGMKEKSIVIRGSLDPWMSLSDSVAKKMGRTSIPRIEYNSLSALKESNSGSIRNSTIYYSDLYTQGSTSSPVASKPSNVAPTKISTGVNSLPVPKVTSVPKRGDGDHEGRERGEGHERGDGDHFEHDDD